METVFLIFFKKQNICKFNVWSTNLCGSDNNLKMGKKVFLFFLFSKRQLHAGKLQRNKNSYKFVLPFTEKHSGLKQNRRIGRRPWCTAEKKDKVHTEFVTCVF